MGALPGLFLLRLCHRPLTCLGPPKSWAWSVHSVVGVDWPIDFGGLAGVGEAADGDGDEKETGEVATMFWNDSGGQLSSLLCMATCKDRLIDLYDRMEIGERAGNALFEPF